MSTSWNFFWPWTEIEVGWFKQYWKNIYSSSSLVVAENFWTKQLLLAQFFFFFKKIKFKKDVQEHTKNKTTNKKSKKTNQEWVPIQTNEPLVITKSLINGCLKRQIKPNWISKLLIWPLKPTKDTIVSFKPNVPQNAKKKKKELATKLFLCCGKVSLGVVPQSWNNTLCCEPNPPQKI